VDQNGIKIVDRCSC